MKSFITTAAAGILLLSGFAFRSKDKYEISPCLVSFTGTTDLKAAEPDHLPLDKSGSRTVPTARGEVPVSRIEGYRILYYNPKNAPFVNMKVELCSEETYLRDRETLIASQQYLTQRSPGTKWVEMKINGYDICGTSRTTIEQGATLGTFMMFPGNGVVVYFYINNMKEAYRNFNSVEDYEQQRDQFIDAYTRFIGSCDQ